MAHKVRYCEEAPAGGVELPAELRRNLPPLPRGEKSGLVKHIMRLQVLHPEVKLKFRDVKLTDLDEDTLKVLLEDMNEQLGVD